MRTNNIVAAMIAVFVLALVGSAVAADFYVVRDKMGQSTVMEGKPGLGWMIVDGPFDTKDAALRVLGAARATPPTAAPTRAGDDSAEMSEFYVVKDDRGMVTVTRGLPSVGWAVVSGPYAWKDAAERAASGSPKPTAQPGSAALEETAKDKYYVVKDKVGQTVVHQGETGPGWTRVSGPYDTIDEAQRTIGGAVKPTAKP
ncbi:MAG: hypothetical protein RDU20_19370 [Desulfomonilaceae bacterium]|nr:hypothetical protein [Desulfomonilaceae bacterium]